MIYPEKRTILTAFQWKAYDYLEPKTNYKVIKAFTDFDGDIIPIGWQGLYKAYNYFPYDDGLSLAFDTDKGLCIIRLQVRSGSQHRIAQNLDKHFSAI